MSSLEIVGVIDKWPLFPSVYLYKLQLFGVDSLEHANLSDAFESILSYTLDMMSTYIDAHEIHLQPVQLLHPGIKEDGASTRRTKLVQVALGPKLIGAQRLFTALHDDVFAGRIHEQVAIAKANGAVARNDLLLFERRRERHAPLHFAAVTERIISLCVGWIELW